LFLGEVSFGAELSDPFTEVLDQGAVEHSAQNYTYCMQRSTYNAYQLSEAEYLIFLFRSSDFFLGAGSYCVIAGLCWIVVGRVVRWFLAGVKME
jgi:hypothetical protein